MTHRTAILHYHLFKNAGTSLDQILQTYFQDRWATSEFPKEDGDNSRLVADWIRNNDSAVAFSTHTAMGPVPQVEDVGIITIMLLRDPIARIRSAYRFERQQTVDTRGAKLAREHDLRGYVEARLAVPGDRQCRNFQTHRLASMVPGDAPELERAMLALKQLSVVGVVEDFGGFLERLSTVLWTDFPDFSAKSVRANATPRAAETEGDRQVNANLQEVNADDYSIWKALKAQLGQNG